MVNDWTMQADPTQPKANIRVDQKESKPSLVQGQVGCNDANTTQSKADQAKC